MNVPGQGDRAHDLCGGSTVPGDGRPPFHRDMPNTRLRNSPQQLSLNHSILMDGSACEGLTCYQQRAGGGGLVCKCNVYPSPRLLVLGGGGTVLNLIAHTCTGE